MSYPTILAFVQVLSLYSLFLSCQGLAIDNQDSEVIFSINSEELNDGFVNERPIIGILAQELPFALVDFFPNATSYISASYVKYLESAGARIVPVMIDQDEEYYEKIFNSTNGLLIPGGSVSIYNSGYASAGKQLYNLALEAFDARDDFYPIWGTCLGFELLALLSVNGQENLAACNSWPQPSSLVFRPEWEESRIGSASPQEVDDILAAEEVAMNFHHWCITPENFTKFGLDAFWNNLALANDLDGLEYIAALESKKYPFWGSQFHPEKNAFEWTMKYPTIPHSANAIKASNFFANFFVEQARKSAHSFESIEEEEKHLIYNYSPTYTGQKAIDFSMQQSYMFY